MDNKILKTLIGDSLKTANNMQNNIDNISILKYYAAKLAVLSSEILAGLNRE